MSEYRIEDSIVIRDGEPLATIEGDTVTSDTALHHKVKEKIVGLIGKEVTFVSADAPSGTGEGVPTEETPTADLPTDPAPLTILPSAKASKKGEIPPAPAQDPASGDKTPAYVEWRRKYYPEEAAKEYSGRVLNI